MLEKTIAISANDGPMETIIVHPEAPGEYPVVLMYMDALGLREELLDMARRIATVGYYTLLPNMFYRAGGPSFDPSRLPHYLNPKVQELNHGTTHAMVLNDTQAILNYVANEAFASDGPMACIGYCMGGRHAYAAAAKYPQYFKAAASIHGGFLVTDKADSPHQLTANIQAEMYFGFADGDEVAPIEHMEIIDGLMRQHQVRAQVEMHHASKHGFIFPQRYCYDKAAAERVWERWFALLRRNLTT